MEKKFTVFIGMELTKIELKKTIDYVENMKVELAKSLRDSLANKATWAHYDRLLNRLVMFSRGDRIGFTQKMKENLGWIVRDVRENKLYPGHNPLNGSSSLIFTKSEGQTI